MKMFKMLDKTRFSFFLLADFLTTIVEEEKVYIYTLISNDTVSLNLENNVKIREVPREIFCVYFYWEKKNLVKLRKDKK